MKKILIAAHSLGLGGIETSLITLIKQLEKNYNITLVLEKKEGLFLEKISPEIKIIEYTPNNDKNVFIRKIINMVKQFQFKIKYKNKFDFAVSYATYSLSSGFIARNSSRNSALWIHADYLSLYHNDKEKTKKYYKSIKVDKYKRIVFVSKEAQRNFISMFPNLKEKTINCNNLIDAENLIKKEQEQIETKDIDKIKKEQETIFLNIGRHDEKQKKLSRLIKTAKMLREDNYKFKILFVGDGQDTDLYKQQVKEKNLEDTIIFLGKKQNPYPYYRISDCVVLTSDYEGYPVVFLESMILQKPIITTMVSDYEEIENKYGLVTTKDINDIYEKMKQFLESGIVIKQSFDYKEYNRKIMQKLEKIINESSK